MTIQTYGLVNVPNTTVTMITTHDEVAQLSVNTDGERLEQSVITKRLRSFDQTRANRQSQREFGDDQVAARMFPV